MKVYKNKDLIISIVYRNDDWVKGLNFLTPDNMFIQVGSWWYDKGKKYLIHMCIMSLRGQLFVLKK